MSNLYLTNSAGRSLRRLGFDQVHTIFPTVTDDGRVLYTRWEYNDRGQIFPQILFQMNTDGTAQQALYGGDSWFPTNIIHARKIPGSREILAVVTGHHRPAQGKLAVIDPAVGRREGRGVQLIAPIRRTDYQRVDQYALDGTQFQYPYPVTGEHFLVTAALPTPRGKTGRFNIYFMDREGRRELLVEGRQSGEGIGCRRILPLTSRPRPPVRPCTIDYRKDTGTLIVQDVYNGTGLRGIARGIVKQLRVVALEYRVAAIGNIPNQQGRGGSSEVSTPVAIGNGSWDVKVVLGTAKVLPDGSAMFRVPRGRLCTCRPSMKTTRSCKPCGVGPRSCRAKRNRAWAVTTTATTRHAPGRESPWLRRPGRSRSLRFTDRHGGSASPMRSNRSSIGTASAATPVPPTSRSI